MLGQTPTTSEWDVWLTGGEYVPAPSQAAATEQAIAASLEGPGGAGGGAGQGQPETVSGGAAGGFGQALSDAASSVLAVVEAPFKAVGGVLTGIQTTGQYLPLILFSLGAVALFVMLPRSGRG